MPKRLTQLRLDKVDRVDAGAQPDAHITLVKRREADATPRTPVGKMTDPASLDAHVTRVRQAARMWAESEGYWSWWPESVYDTFVLMCGGDMDSMHRVDYTETAGGEVEFADPIEVGVTVTFTEKRLWKADYTRKRPKKGEPPMSTIKTAEGDLDLSGLDDDVRKRVEALAAERDTAIAKTTEPDDEPTADDVIKSLPAEAQTLIAKQSEDIAALRKQADEDRDRAVRLEKAERRRLFKSMVRDDLAKIAPHATVLVKDDDADAETARRGDGVDQLATLIDEIDAVPEVGTDLAERLVKVLRPLDAQVREFTTTLTKTHGIDGIEHVIGKGDGAAAARNAEEATLEDEIGKMLAENPDLSRHQVVARIAKQRPDLLDAVRTAE